MIYSNHPDAASVAARSAKILVIDDEESLCIGVTDLFDLEGHSAEYRLNGVEGLAYLEQHPEIDLVLLDINLGPGPTGVDLLPKIKELCSHTQVVMFTSQDAVDVAVECMKLGAIDYVSKPFDETLLLSKIPMALERKNLSQLNDLYLNILVHDLKNPLQGIIGAFELLKSAYGDQFTSSHHKFVDRAYSGINQMLTTMKNILSISQFEKGALRGRRELFSIRESLEQTLGDLENRIQAQGIRVDFLCPEGDAAHICSDQELFGQVSLNILSNAVRFTPDNERITVVASNTGDDTVMVSIANTGSFIDEHARKGIFDKFFGVQAAHSSLGNHNFGLGLTYSKMAVDAMGGRIWIESDPDVPSTTFHFTIRNFQNG
jgi:signal transduction histidine kinase